MDEGIISCSSSTTGTSRRAPFLTNTSPTKIPRTAQRISRFLNFMANTFPPSCRPRAPHQPDVLFFLLAAPYNAQNPQDDKDTRNGQDREEPVPQLLALA